MTIQQPQAGDVWQKPEGTFCFVQNADFGKLKWCYGCGGWDYVDNDPVREKMKEAVLRWREGKSYPPASQPPADKTASNLLWCMWVDMVASPRHGSPAKLRDGLADELREYLTKAGFIPAAGEKGSAETYQPPAGGMITVPCVVMASDEDTVRVSGHSLMTAQQTANCFSSPFRQAAVFPLVVPKSLLTPAVLPEVTAGETVTP